MEFLLRLWARVFGSESNEMKVQKQAVDVGQHLYRIYDTSVTPDCCKGEVHVRAADDENGIPRSAEWHAGRRAKQRLGHESFRLELLNPDDGPIKSGLRSFIDLFR